MKIKLSVLAVAMLIGGPLFAADSEKKAYPLKTCVVSGEALDSMGGPYVFQYEGKEVQLCCKSCKKKFDKDPASFISKIKGT